MKLLPTSFHSAVLVALLCVVVVGLTGCGKAAAPSTPPATTSAARIATAANTQTNEFVWETNSLFDPNLKGGRDPFYPESRRRDNSSSASNVAAKKVEPVICLKGITGPASRRLALINNQVLAVGEEAKVRVPDGQVVVRCLEIGGQSVKVLIQGEARPRELQISTGK